MTSPETLYKKMDPDKIKEIITDFYNQAFADPIIGHFFFKKDQERLIKLQVMFTQNLLQGSSHDHERYMKKSHQHLKIRPAHFKRRQKILEEVLEDHLSEPTLISFWLEREAQLLSYVVST